MKIATVVGARPQFIKAAVINRVINRTNGIEEILIHTGQHYDENMSKIFFDELEIPKPNYNLEVGSGLHGKQTATMLERIENVLISEKPDLLLVYGDTNSTIAGALAATKLHIKVAHVEAGLRSFNKKMPEEINRIVTDSISDMLFAPTQNALNLLKLENHSENAFFTGDVMFDSILHYSSIAGKGQDISKIINEDYYLATVHRAENTDDKQRLQAIFDAFSQADKKVILPLHPRTQKLLEGINFNENVKIIEPVGYLEMINLIKNSNKILTDSGGLQKEAFFMKKPCITLRDETEWVETLQGNWNFVVGTDTEKIVEKLKNNHFSEQKSHFGDGKAGEKIIELILQKM